MTGTELSGFTAGVVAFIGSAWLWSQPIASVSPTPATLQHLVAANRVEATKRCRLLVARALESRGRLLFPLPLDSMDPSLGSGYTLRGRALGESMTGDPVELAYTCTVDAAARHPVELENVEHSF